MTEDEIHDLGSRIAADVMGNDHLSHKLDEQQADEVHGHIQEAVVRALCDTALSRRAEPVGWQHRGRIADGPWSDWRPGRNHNFDTAEGHEFEERPVYASPSPATGARVKPLHWTESWVFGKRKWRGSGVFGEFAAFGDEYLTPNEVAAKKAAIEAQYAAAILSALTSSGNADPAVEIDEAMQPQGLRVCPQRDGLCPHGMACPYSIDRFNCDMDASRAGLKGAQP